METLSQLFHFAVTQFNRPDLLTYRGKDGSFQRISTNEFRDRVVHFALGLRTLGVKKNTRILFLSENRPEWHCADFACHVLAAVTVPVFPTLIPEQIQYIFENSGAELVLVSDEEQLKKIQEIRGNLKRLKHVIVFDADLAGADVLSFEQTLAKGREQSDKHIMEEALKNATPGMTATIIYTSGTTGVPKGVVLSHDNLVSNMLASAEVLQLTCADTAMSFLPLSHAFERTVDYVYFYRGMSIVYSANMDALLADLAESRPTIMACVPRFYEKIKARVEAKVDEDGGIKKILFEWALAVGAKKGELAVREIQLNSWLKLRAWLADKVVFVKIRERTGGRIRFFISGGAPLSAEVGRFFEAIGLRILEGYGLTETSPVISVNPPARPKFGTVGTVLPNVEVKIGEDGEVLARGPSVMSGYYKLPEETNEVLKDGWFHTGDIGSFDEDGYLVITDRKKQLLVTSVGKKVAPQPIEKAVEASKYIEQVLLVGDKRNFITALIVPDFDQLKLFAASKQLQSEPPAALVEHGQVRELVQREVEAHQDQFSRYEQIRKFELLSESLTVENGYLTPTMKIKRKVVLSDYADLVEKMYSGD